MMNHHRKQKQKQRMKFYLSHEQEQDEGKPCDTNVSPTTTTHTVSDGDHYGAGVCVRDATDDKSKAAGREGKGGAPRVCAFSGGVFGALKKIQRLNEKSTRWIEND